MHCTVTLMPHAAFAVMAMATSAATTMLLVLVLSTSSTATLPVAMADAGFIATTCNKTHNDKCVAVLTANPDSADASTVSDLAGVALDRAVAAASDAGAVINDRSSRYGGTAEGDALRVCSGAYFDAANDLDIDAHDSLGSGDYATASRLVSGAGGAADRCEGAFAAAKVSSVMADVDQKMKERCSVARDLINLLIPPK
ncbi:hypothetical protein E2562_012671 [Oryza meyeriana var. granulata]|uniref:Pectinesterase inhibitor domain-containing protein n=1 Tax=Oryza meyeriana var. granulata TaxID=110450 RepID=A0A6G1CER6_9ORYZ|nr:hypothetical protein E2562_012671 [Oryza meyeriana var. granulata]